MSRYAKINAENIVENVILASSSYISSQDGLWIEITESTGNTNTGESYSPDNGKFIPNKPFESWIFNEELFDWISPAGPKPSTGDYFWNEAEQEWTEIISELSE